MEEQALITQRDRPATFRMRAGRLDQTRCFWRHLSTLCISPELDHCYRPQHSRVKHLSLVLCRSQRNQEIYYRHVTKWSGLRLFLGTDFLFLSFFITLYIFLESPDLAQIVSLPVSKYTIILIRNPEGQTEGAKEHSTVSVTPPAVPGQQTKGHQGAQSALSPRPEICSLPSSLRYEWNLGREFHFGSEVVLLAFSRNKKQPTVLFLWTISSTLLLVQAACDKCVTNMEPNLCLVFAS